MFRGISVLVCLDDNSQMTAFATTYNKCSGPSIRPQSVSFLCVQGSIIGDYSSVQPVSTSGLSSHSFSM